MIDQSLAVSISLLIVVVVVIWMVLSYVLDGPLFQLVWGRMFSAAKLVGVTGIAVDGIAAASLAVWSVGYWYPSRGAEAFLAVPVVAGCVCLIGMKVCRLDLIGERRRAENRPDDIQESVRKTLADDAQQRRTSKTST